MTKEKVREVLDIYRKKFEEMRLPRTKIVQASCCSPKLEYLAHCHAMLDEMEKFIDEGRMDKVMRWLGFLQGVLWTCRIYDLEELKNHSRP